MFCGSWMDCCNWWFNLDKNRFFFKDEYAQKILNSVNRIVDKNIYKFEEKKNI